MASMTSVKISRLTEESTGRFLQHEYTADLLCLNIGRPVHPHMAPELLAVSTPLNVDS